MYTWKIEWCTRILMWRWCAWWYIRSCVPFTGPYKRNEPVLYSDPFWRGLGVGLCRQCLLWQVCWTLMIFPCSSPLIACTLLDRTSVVLSTPCVVWPQGLHLAVAYEDVVMLCGYSSSYWVHGTYLCRVCSNVWGCVHAWNCILGLIFTALIRSHICTCLRYGQTISMVTVCCTYSHTYVHTYVASCSIHSTYIDVRGLLTCLVP